MDLRRSTYVAIGKKCLMGSFVCYTVQQTRGNIIKANDMSGSRSKHAIEKRII